jgi:hypothetical protein
LSLTEKWPISCFNEDFSIRRGFSKDKDCIAAKKALDGVYTKVNKNVLHAVKIYKSRMQKDIVESLILAEDCEYNEISDLTKVPIEVIMLYAKLFFRVEEAFISKIDLLDYIETGVSTYAEAGPEYSEELESFLLKRWVISLGKEFVNWRYRLKPVNYSSANLYNTILREAFFYHKEKAMGNEEITLSEYLRSTNSLLGNVKSATAVKETSEEDAGLDMLEYLDIIIEDVKAPSITLDEIKDGDFINNALQQESK